MGKSTSTIWEVAREGQERWDRLKLRAKEKLNAFDPVVLLAYRGHGGNGRLRIVGRVVEEKGVDKPQGESNVFRNVANTIRRFESDEIPDARVIARYGETDLAEGRTDNEGFFQLIIEPEEDPPPGWAEVEVELLESVAGGAGTRAIADIVIPPPDAEFGVISDIDDTVLETRATDLLTELRLVFSKSARERSSMPGAAPLYRRLEGGPDGDGWNPFFYVSMSGWGLYDLIETFLDHNDLPKGPIYLQDLAFIERKSAAVGSEKHKHDTIGQLLDDYPDLPFVLIGDSGQKDPETYRDIVEDRGDRIRAVLIRAVTPPDRDSEVREIVQDITDMGVAAAAAESSVSLARAAADFGLIPDAAIDEVREGMVRGRQV